MFVYSAYGLVLASDLPIPEFRPGAGEPDVHIRILDHRPECQSADSPIICTEAGPASATLAWGTVGTLLIEDGRSISVFPGTEGDEQSLKLFVAGAGIGVLLHQRGMLVMHGSAVSVNGNAVAFLGAKGWGKSTTAIALHKRGHPLITDELLVINPSNDGTPTVRPGSPYLKLWSDALAGIGGKRDLFQPIVPGADKYYFGASAWTTLETPLKRFYVLDGGNELKTATIGSPDAFFSVLPHLYVSRFGTPFLQSSGAQSTIPQLFALLNEVEVVRLVRRHNLDELQEIAELIESELIESEPHCKTEPRIGSGALVS